MIDIEMIDNYRRLSILINPVPEEIIGFIYSYLFLDDAFSALSIVLRQRVHKTTPFTFCKFGLNFRLA